MSYIVRGVFNIAAKRLSEYEQLLFTADDRKQHNDNTKSEKTTRHIHNITKQKHHTQ